jgi:hypothetical protein
MNIFISILMNVLGSETIKVMAKKATKKLLDRTGTGIDPELSKALLEDIANSTSNNVTIATVNKIIKGL